MPTGPISAFIDRHYLHFNAATLKDAATHPSSRGGRRQDAAHRRGAMSTAELGISMAEMIRSGKIHAICCGRQSRGGRLQPRGAFPLRARPALSGPDAGGRTGAAGPSPEPRHRHVHSRRGSDAPDRADRARRVDGRRPARRSAVSARVSVSHSARRHVEAVLRNRSEEQLAAGRVGRQPADIRARLGGLDARERVRRALPVRSHQVAADDAGRDRIHDGAGQLVSRDQSGVFDRVFPNRRRDRRRLPDLRRADAPSGLTAS